MVTALFKNTWPVLLVTVILMITSGEFLVPGLLCRHGCRRQKYVLVWHKKPLQWAVLSFPQVHTKDGII